MNISEPNRLCKSSRSSGKEWSVFFCGQIAILFHEINFPGPTLNALHTCKPSCVNSKWCRLLKLAILSISRVSSVPGLCTLTPSFLWLVSLSMRYTCFWLKQHHDLRCSISWLMLSTETESCHPYLFQPVAQNDRTSRVRFLGDVRALVRMILAYICDNNVLIWS